MRRVSRCTGRNDALGGISQTNTDNLPRLLLGNRYMITRYSVNLVKSAISTRMCLKIS